jgi:hypothetical protein
MLQRIESSANYQPLGSPQDSVNQEVVAAESDVEQLQLESIHTGAYLATINGINEANLSKQAQDYKNDLGRVAKANNVISATGILSQLIPVLAGAASMACADNTEGLAFKGLSAMANGGQGALMMTSAVSSGFEAKYQEASAQSQYVQAMGGTSMKLLTQAAGVFAGGDQTLVKTEQSMAQALATKIAAEAAGKQSTTIYGGK